MGQTQMIPSSLDAKLARLRADLAGFGRVVVACSGGVDSCLLAVVAHQELGPSALVVTAMSPAVPSEEVAQVEALATEFGFRWQAVQTEELARPGYVTNAGESFILNLSAAIQVSGRAYYTIS